MTFAMEKLSCVSDFRVVSWALYIVLAAIGKNYIHLSPCILIQHILFSGRICIALNSGGQQAGFWALSGTFEIAHMDENIPGDLQYPKG